MTKFIVAYTQEDITELDKYLMGREILQVH